jgi:chromatin segregation and condensation protein Rec8/ScpA/Scc1 (kleisin family)
MFDLLAALRTALDRYHRENPPPYHLRGESFSVSGQIRRLLEAMRRGRPYDLIGDLRGRSCRSEAVSAFLAVLEMARLNLVRLHQTEGGEILLYRTTRDLAPEEMEAVEG